MSQPSPANICFPPVLNKDVEVLLLGSFPGQVSLQKNQYYGHPQNQFWRLLSAALNTPLTEMSYEAKLDTLLVNHIGLWDVVACCEREGSLDSNIRNAQHNDMNVLETLAPKLKWIGFNGKQSGKYERFFSAQGLETFVLPSSSPAYTLSFQEKLKSWEHFLKQPAASLP